MQPPDEQARPQRYWSQVVLIAIVAAIIGVAENKTVIDSRTRPAAARDGGKLLETKIEKANVKVEGEGPAILLIHGFGAALDWWDAIAPALAKQHRVVRLDLIGHGGTAAPIKGYAITRQAELAAAVLERLNIDRVTVIGHSMGGEVATALACLIPKRIDRLILIDSPPTTVANFTWMTHAYLTPVLGEAMAKCRFDSAIRQGLRQGFAPDFQVPEQFVDDLKQLTYSAFRKSHNGSVAYRSERPTNERLSGLDPIPPLLVIFGTRDAIVPPEHAQLFKRVPGAKVALIDGVGHSPMVEAPEKTLALIEEFLK